MDPNQLIGPMSPMGYPAPYWFLVFFKVLGFTLHMIAMNVWYIGILLCMGLYWRGSEHGKRLSGRLMNQMPVIISIGVNLGIVPLLFLQVAYYRVFYPATILMAWTWFSVFFLLTVAYYGVYYYVIGLRKGDAALVAGRKLAGWVSAVLFIVIGFIFANAMSLMAHVKGWPDIWFLTSKAGAALGTGHNLGDGTLYPRWLLMIGLAIMTTSAYITLDTALFARRESEDYRRWAWRFSFTVYSVGLVWFALAGSHYVFASWPVELRAAMFSGPRAILTVATALLPGLPWLLLLLKRKTMTVAGAGLIGASHLLTLAANAISRQVVQNESIRPYLDVTAEPVTTQWSPLILFLLLFIAGVGVVIWLLAKAVQAAKAAPAH